MNIYNTFSILRSDLKNDARKWREIDEESFDEMLDSMPPLAMNSKGFITSEPHTHLSNGQPVYLSCIKSEKSFFAAYLTLNEFKKSSLRSIPSLPV